LPVHLYQKSKKARTEHGGAYLDISHKPAAYVRKNSQQFNRSRNSPRGLSPKAPWSRPHLPDMRVALWHAKPRNPRSPACSTREKLAAGLPGFESPRCNSLSDSWSSAADRSPPQSTQSVSTIPSITRKIEQAEKGIAHTVFQPRQRNSVRSSSRFAKK